MHSSIYEGVVSHCRHEPVVHRFQYRLFMVYLDLDELDQIVGRRQMISANRFAACSFLENDHLFDRERPLADEVREIVARQTGSQPEGPIRLLTQLRTAGYYMSPLNLFYLFDRGGERVESVLAEVNNTPWNERHCYLLNDSNRDTTTSDDQRQRFRHAKDFHVSPFMGMDMEYRWQLQQPAEWLSVSLENWQENQSRFAASMRLQRHDLSRRQLRRMVLSYPLMTFRITSAIYYQALKLWWKKCPFYPHPRKQKPTMGKPPLPLDHSIKT